MAEQIIAGEFQRRRTWTAVNFRADLNLDGLVNVTDRQIVRTHRHQSLP